MRSAGQYSVSGASSTKAFLPRLAVKTEESSPMKSAGLVLVGSLGSSGLSIRQPIIAVLESDDDGGFLISDPIFAVYGEGYSATAAHWDYRSSLEDYFFLLKDHSEKSAEDKQQFDKLKSYVDFELRRLEFRGN